MSFFSGIAAFFRRIFGSVTQIGGRGNLGAQSGDHGQIAQRGVSGLDSGGGHITVIEHAQGLTGRDMRPLLEQAFQHGRKVGDEYAARLEEENRQLQLQVNAAIRRAQQAQRRSSDAHVAVEAIRKTGDTELLLRFLVGERDRLPDENRKLEIAREIAAVAYLRGEIELAENAVQQILTALPDDLEALTYKGFLHQLRGQLEEAEAGHSRVLDLARARQDAGWEAAACGNLGVLHGIRGNLDDAQRLFRKALEIEKKLGHKEGLASAYGNLGIICRIRGDLDQAERMFRKGLKTHEQLGRKQGMANTYGNLGIVYRIRGDLDEAERFFGKGLEIERQLGRKEGMANAYTNLGNVYQMRGDLDEAERMHRRSMQINEQIGNKVGMSNQHGSLGNIYLARGDLDEAEQMYRKALAIEDGLGRKEGIASHYANLGLVYEKRGDLDRARQFWRKARDLYAEMGVCQKVAMMEDWLASPEDETKNQQGVDQP